MGAPKQTRGLVQPLVPIDHKENDAGEMTDFLKCGHQLPARHDSSQFRRCPKCPGQFPGSTPRSPEADERRREQEKQRHVRRKQRATQSES